MSRAYPIHEVIHLLESEPSPCEVYNCRMQKHCQQKRVACFAFYWYVSRDRLIDPYITHIERGKVHMGSILPSRGMYKEAMAA